LTHCGDRFIFFDQPTDRSVKSGEQMTQHPEAREAKRLVLIESAMAVFMRQGFARTRVADIATEADVGKGTVYEYFSSKEELFFAVFERIQETIAEQLRGEVVGAGSAREKLERLFRKGAEITRNQVEKQAVVLDFWAASRGRMLEQEFCDFCVSSYAFYRSLIAQILKEGQETGELDPQHDPQALAVIIVAAFDGLGAQLFFDRTVDVERAVAAFSSSLCDALCLEDE
jgi:AcrR family transcriptional regulator